MQICVKRKHEISHNNPYESYSLSPHLTISVGHKHIQTYFIWSKRYTKLNNLFAIISLNSLRSMLWRFTYFTQIPNNFKRHSWASTYDKTPRTVSVEKDLNVSTFIKHVLLSVIVADEANHFFFGFQLTRFRYRNKIRSWADKQKKHESESSIANKIWMILTFGLHHLLNVLYIN